MLHALYRAGAFAYQPNISYCSAQMAGFFTFGIFEFESSFTFGFCGKGLLPFSIFESSFTFGFVAH
jgi:hypothetical protein